MTINQQELGVRIAYLRKEFSYSQEELARVVGISRSAVAQIEGGGRGLSAQELMDFADAFSLTADQLMSSDFDYYSEVSGPLVKKSLPDDIRVSIPEMQIEKVKQILLYLLEKCAGKANIGMTALNKLLYFSDFNYYELYEDHLSGAEYRKLPQGPVPVKLEKLLKKMAKEELVQRVETKYHGYIQHRFLPLEKPDLSLLKASETEIIDRVVEQYGDLNGSALSELSHRDLPWAATADREVIDYELAFYREYPFSVRSYAEEEYDVRRN